MRWQPEHRHGNCSIRPTPWPTPTKPTLAQIRRCIRAAYSALRQVQARSGATRPHGLVAVRTERRNLVQPRRPVLEVRCRARRNLPRSAGVQHRRRRHGATSTRSTPRSTPTATLVYGVFNDVDIRSEARHDELTTKFTQVSLEGKHAFSDAFNMRAQVGFRRSEPRQPGADDAAVRCAQYRRLQLRLSRRTAACR